MIAIGCALVAAIEAVVIAWLLRPHRAPLPSEQVDRLHRVMYGQGRTP